MPTFLGGVDLPGSRSKSRYSTCLSPFGFTIGLLPPSAVMGALSFMFYISQERMLLLPEEEHWGSVTVKQTSDFNTIQHCHNNHHLFAKIARDLTDI